VSETNVDKFLPLTTLAFEVMLAVAEGQLHGYEIMTAVEQRTGGVLSPNPGTLYLCFAKTPFDWQAVDSSDQ